MEGYSQCESYYLATAMDLFAFTFFEMLMRCPLSLQDTNTLKEKKNNGPENRHLCVSLVLAAAARVALLRFGHSAAVARGDGVMFVEGSAEASMGKNGPRSPGEVLSGEQ